MTTEHIDPIEDELALRDRLPPPAERRALREQVGLSRARVAAALDVAQETVKHWESGDSVPRRSNLRAYAALLDQLRAAADGREAS
jgi:DNA-binding transcriptional regulator YiaG